MIVVQTTYSRSSIDIPWYHESWTEEMRKYVFDNYNSTGKIEGSFFENSNRLKITFIHIFPSDEVREEWDNDYYLNMFREDRKEYNLSMGITYEIEVQE